MSQSGSLGSSGGSLPPNVPLTFTTDSGVAVAAANNLNVLGAGGASTSAAGSTITVTSSGIAWSNITASQALVVNRGYFCVSAGGALSLSLPATSAVGSVIEVSLDGATSFTITQGAGQQIRLGNVATTAGVGGSLASTQQGDSVRIVCRTANLLWNVLSSMGNPTIV